MTRLTVDNITLEKYLKSRWYPGILVGYEGKAKDEDGFYHVLLPGAKKPYRCVTAGFELGNKYLNHPVMIAFNKPLDRWVIVSTNA